MSGAEPARDLVGKPPKSARRAVDALYLIWLALFLFWSSGALGWLKWPRETFTLPWLIAINGLGVVAAFVREGVEKHYRRKALRAADAVAPQ